MIVSLAGRIKAAKDVDGILAEAPRDWRSEIADGQFEECRERVRPMAATYVDIVGWISSAAVIIAYALISLNKLNGRSRVYQVLNLFGSLGLIANTAYYRAYPSTFVNAVWLLIAAATLFKIARAPDQRTTPI